MAKESGMSRLESDTTEVVEPVVVPEAVVPADTAPEVDVSVVEPRSSVEATEGSGVGADAAVTEEGADVPVDAEPEVDHPRVAEPCSFDGLPKDVPAPVPVGVVPDVDTEVAKL